MLHPATFSDAAFITGVITGIITILTTTVIGLTHLVQKLGKLVRELRKFQRELHLHEQKVNVPEAGIGLPANTTVSSIVAKSRGRKKSPGVRAKQIAVAAGAPNFPKKRNAKAQVRPSTNPIPKSVKNPAPNPTRQ